MTALYVVAGKKSSGYGCMIRWFMVARLDDWVMEVTRCAAKDRKS